MYVHAYEAESLKHSEGKRPKGSDEYTDPIHSGVANMKNESHKCEFKDPRHTLR